jgi:cell division protein FtsL
MRNSATVFASALSLAAAYQLYAENIETRRLEQQVQSAERQRDRLENDISVLRADRAYLARPARIEPAARALGLVPPDAANYVAFDDIARRPPGEARDAPR